MNETAARIHEASSIRPSARQLAWQQLEFYGFIHFGMNTMTDREWGAGHEDPVLFDPSHLDADQWIRTLKDSGMRAVILTAKHHDGFCLWPSDFTRHSVAASPWRGGTGDLVAEVAAACRRHDLQLGIYLSPWDRTEPTYGSGAAYNDFFVGQLTELCTRYGPLFSVWFDGACGEGPGGGVQRYDWDRYVRAVRALQPEAVISVCGPDVRWCGNEAGEARQNEWSVVPASLRDAERTAERSQQSDDPSFSRRVRSDDQDLGSIEALRRSPDPLVWYPAEVNTSIRPGWFHHPSEDHLVRSVDELWTIWARSVGGNSTLLLNVPPTREGIIHPTDAARLEELGDRIHAFYERAITQADGSTGRPWVPDEAIAEPALELRWDGYADVEAIVVEEDIAFGQQIDGLTVQGILDDRVVDLTNVQSIGYRRIIPLQADRLRGVGLRVTGRRGPVRLKNAQVMGQKAPTETPR